MKIHKILAVIAVFGFFDISIGYRILAFYPLPIRSHFILLNQFFKGLAERGHTVDIISTFDVSPTPNYTQIIKLGIDSPEFGQGVTYETATTFFDNITRIMGMGYDLCKHLGNPQVVELARNPPKDPPYDLIITQLLNMPCFNIFGYLWNLPILSVSTSSLYPWMHDNIGNPENIAYSASNIAQSRPGEHFWERFYNVYIFYYFKFYYLYYSRDQRELLKEYFGPDIPTISELERNVSLILVNTYFPINDAKPHATGLLEVGGLHIQNETPKLSDDLQKWLDESKDGVVYLNFGSMVKLESFPLEKLNIIFNALKKIAPTRVLLRVFDHKNLPVEIPPNFHVLPWIPQQSVLKHPNVKVFITHGGLLGTQESIYYGVSMICVPFFADQYSNCKNYEEKKIGILIDHFTLNKKDLEHALDEILHNPIYRDNIKRLSSLFKDRPLNAMDTAVYWTEYVIRNGGEALRSKSMNLTWWQESLLDVYGFVFTIILVIFITIVLVVKKICCIIFCKKENILLEKKKHC